MYLAKAVAWLAAGGLAAALVSRRRPRFHFRGKHVVITGGSRGLGLVLARQLGREGARVALCARDEVELGRAERDLISRGVRCLAVKCDVTAPARVRDFVATARAELGPVDVLIHNAGIIQVGPLATMTEADFAHAMDVHFWAAYHAVQAVLPDFGQRGTGRIVLISSIGGKISPPHLLPYNVSKFALTGYGEGLAAELAKDGIHVTTVIPGLMRTGSPRNALFKGRHRKEFAWFSVSDSLPLLTASAERAARRILRACALGKRELILTPAARFAVAAHGLSPGFVIRSLEAANRLLPSEGGIGERAVSGSQSTSFVSRSLLTRLTQKAAARNNEIRS